MPGLDSTVLRTLLLFSPRKRRLFNRRLAAMKTANLNFATRVAQRRLTQPLIANTLGLGPVPRMQFPRQPFTKMTLGDTARGKLGLDRTFVGRAHGFDSTRARTIPKIVDRLWKRGAHLGSLADAATEGVPLSFVPLVLHRQAPISAKRFNVIRRQFTERNLKLKQTKPWQIIKEHLRSSADINEWPRLKAKRHRRKLIASARKKEPVRLQRLLRGWKLKVTQPVLRNVLKEGIALRHSLNYNSFTRTQQAALRSARPAKPRHVITRKSTLPANWASNYMSALRFIGGKEKKDLESKKALRVLRRMSRDLYVENRGEAFIPRADSNGFYPVYASIPYNVIQTAIRKNTSKRVRWASWLRVAASGQPYRVPEEHSSLTRTQQQHLLAHASIALPHKKGRYPALLGKAVPGQLLGRSGSVIQLKDIDPEEWAKGGFTAMKFGLSTKLGKWFTGPTRASHRMLGRAPGVSRMKILKREIIDTKTKGLHKSVAGAMIRKRLGPPKMTTKQTRHFMKSRVRKGTKVNITSKGLPHYINKKVTTSRYPGVAAHEATHSRQAIHKAVFPVIGLAQSVGSIGALVHGIKAGRREGEERKKHLKKAVKWGALGFAPRLLSEGHANIHAWRAGGKKLAKLSMKGYLAQAGGGVAGAIGQGYVGGRIASTKKGRKLRSQGSPVHPIREKTQAHRIPQDLIVYYENGIHEGLAQKWRGFKWKVKQALRPAIRWTRMKLLPAASEGAIKGTLTSLQQQTGMLPPTTIDLQPIKILALSSAYRDIPDDALRALITGLRGRYLQEIDLELRRALQKKIADIQVELQGRRII